MSNFTIGLVVVEYIAKLWILVKINHRQLIIFKARMSYFSIPL